METRWGLLLLIPTGAPDLLSWVTWGQMEQRSPQTTGWDKVEPRANLLQEHPRKPSSTQQCATRGAEAELFFPPTTPCSLAAPKQQNWGETHNSRAMDAAGGRNHSVQHSEVGFANAVSHLGAIQHPARAPRPFGTRRWRCS